MKKIYPIILSWEKYVKIFSVVCLIIALAANSSISQPMVTISDIKNECLSLDNGSAEILVMGSVPIGADDALLNVFGPVTLLGQPLTTGAPFSLNNLPNGTYIVIVQDATGNAVLNFIIVDVITPINIAADSGNPIDNTGCVVPNGEINVTVSGGSGTSFTYAWTGPNGFTATSEDITGLSGGTYTLEAFDNGTNCSQTATFTIEDPSLAVFNIATSSPQVVCSVDDVFIGLDGSEVGITYEALINGAPSGFTAVGTGAPISITIPVGSYGDGDVLTVQVNDGLCAATMNGSVTIDINDPNIFNITTPSPQAVSNEDDVTINLSGSEVGVEYEILVNFVASGFTFTGTGAALDMTITASNFADGDVLRIDADNGQCQTRMNGSVTINIDNGSPVICEESITLTSQAEVNAFDCIVLTGRLTVTGADITDLTPLQTLTQVDAGVFIVNNPNLTSLAGLENLQSIRNTLLIADNPNLTDLNGLSGLSGSIGRIEVRNNTSLTSVAGIPNIGRINNILRIANNPLLTSLQGFESLNRSNILIVEGNNLLTSLQGLEQLDVVRYITISGNNALISIDELAALDANNSLLLLVDINNNPVLSQCCILDGLSGLPNLDLQVSGNDTGCESVADITLTCAASIAQATLFPNPLTNSSRIDLQMAEDYNQAQVIVSDMVNGVVLTRDFNQGQVYLDRSEFQKGIYFCQVIVDGEPTQMIRMLVE
ncbi:MAG: T9SS type A sorting domain-containing protein [Bacteroidota bacterium]